MNDCIHPETTLRKRTKTNGAIVVCEQCDVCGRSLGEKPKSLHNLDALPLWDDSISQEYCATVNAEWKERQRIEAEQQAMRQGEWWEAYNGYLGSAHWAFVRRRVLERDRTCQVCMSAASTQAHHLTYQSYNNIGMSFPGECVGVCEACHNQLHGKGALYGA